MKNGKKIKPFPVIITFQANNFPVDWLNGVSRDDCTQWQIIISKQRYCGTIQRAQKVDICVGAAKPFLQIEIQKGLRTINWEEKTSNRLFNNFISPSHLVIHFYLRLRGCGTDFSDITWTIKRKTAGVINLIATDVYQENRYLCKGNKSWFEFKWNLLEEEKWFGERDLREGYKIFFISNLTKTKNIIPKKGNQLEFFRALDFLVSIHNPAFLVCCLDASWINFLLVSSLDFITRPIIVNESRYQ